MLDTLVKWLLIDPLSNPLIIVSFKLPTIYITTDTVNSIIIVNVIIVRIIVPYQYNAEGYYKYVFLNYKYKLQVLNILVRKIPVLYNNNSIDL